MGYALTALIIVITILFLTKGIIARSKNKKQSYKLGVYKSGDNCSLAVIGIIISLVFSALGIGVADFESVFFAVRMSLIFAVPSIIALAAWSNVYFVYDDDGFTQHTFWGRKKRFTYGQVSGYIGEPGDDIWLLAGKRKIKIGRSMKGGKAFADFVIEKCAQNGEKLQHREKKHDIYKNNIRGGRRIFIAFAFFTVIFTASFILCLHELFVRKDMIRAIITT